MICERCAKGDHCGKDDCYCQHRPKHHRVKGDVGDNVWGNICACGADWPCVDAVVSDLMKGA